MKPWGFSIACIGVWLGLEFLAIVPCYSIASFKEILFYEYLLEIGMWQKDDLMFSATGKVGESWR